MLLRSFIEKRYTKDQSKIILENLKFSASEKNMNFDQNSLINEREILQGILKDMMNAPGFSDIELRFIDLIIKD